MSHEIRQSLSEKRGRAPVRRGVSVHLGKTKISRGHEPEHEKEMDGNRKKEHEELAAKAIGQNQKKGRV